MEQGTQAPMRGDAARAGAGAAGPGRWRSRAPGDAGSAFLRRLRAAFLFHFAVNLCVFSLTLGIVAATYVQYVQRPRLQMASAVYASNLAALAASVQVLPPSERAARLAGLARLSQGLVAADDPRNWGLVEPSPLMVREFIAAVRDLLPAYTIGFTSRPRPLLWIAVPVTQGGTHWIRMDLPTFVELPTGVFAAALGSVLVTVSAGAAYVLARLRSRVARIAQAIDSVDPRSGRMPSVPAVVGGEDLLDLDPNLRDLADRLSEAQAERGILLGQLAGDLRVLVRRLGLAHPGPEVPPDVAGCLRDMQRLVQQLDAFAQPARLDPAHAADINDVLSRMARDASAAGHAIALELGGLPYARVSPAAARRILGNLVDNALRYAGHAEVSSSIEFGWVVVRVRDRGPGVSPQELGLLGKPFYRTDAARAQGAASGLGLAIVKQELGAVDGELRLALRPGGGLQAEVRLHSAELSAGQPPAGAAAGSAVSASYSMRPHRT